MGVPYALCLGTIENGDVTVLDASGTVVADAPVTPGRYCDWSDFEGWDGMADIYMPTDAELEELYEEPIGYNESTQPYLY